MTGANDRLAARWEQIRTIRRRVTVPLEEARRANVIGASLQAAVTLKLAPDEADLLNASEWAEPRHRIGCAHGRRHGRRSRGHRRGSRTEMRPLLASADRGRNTQVSPHPVRPLHRRGRSGMNPAAATRLGLLSGLIVLAADQASKYWILYGLNLPELGQVVLLPVLEP